LCEGEVELGSSFPAGGEAAVVVEPGVGAFDRPAFVCLVVADAAGAGVLLFRDVRSDAAFAECLAQPVGVVAAVGEQPVGSVLAAFAAAAQRRHGVDGGKRVDAVVAVSRPQQQRQRDAAAVAEVVHLGRGTAPVYGAFADAGAPLFASTIVESNSARCQSILPCSARRPCSR